MVGREGHCDMLTNCTQIRDMDVSATPIDRKSMLSALLSRHTFTICILAGSLLPSVFVQALLLLCGSLMNK